VHTPDLKDSLIAEVAKAADICMKPYLHSVSLENQLNDANDLDDLIFKIQCRNIDGEREETMDIELEVYKSGKEVNMTLSWKSLIDRPILWQGKHAVWMDSSSGVQCDIPSDGKLFESLARRLRTIFKTSLN
jgi:hypothetical protein|tara:strand:- start:182 stop:577 length:396 start_codon:yes stop_codon:yes gene_type:complete